MAASKQVAARSHGATDCARYWSSTRAKLPGRDISSESFCAASRSPGLIRERASPGDRAPDCLSHLLIVPPFYENLGKRLIKSPKVYVADAGLACHLLGIDSLAELAKSPFQGALFEGFIASEIAKSQANSGRRRELYYFRDEQGLEVDFLVPGRGGAIALVECKAARTVAPSDAAPMQRLASALRQHRPRGANVELHLVRQPSRNPTTTRAVAPGVRAWAWQDFVDQL